MMCCRGVRSFCKVQAVQVRPSAEVHGVCRYDMASHVPIKGDIWLLSCCATGHAANFPVRQKLHGYWLLHEMFDELIVCLSKVSGTNLTNSAAGGTGSANLGHLIPEDCNTAKALLASAHRGSSCCQSCQAGSRSWDCAWKWASNPCQIVS